MIHWIINLNNLFKMPDLIRKEASDSLYEWIMYIMVKRITVDPWYCSLHLVWPTTDISPHVPPMLFTYLDLRFDIQPIQVNHLMGVSVMSFKSPVALSISLRSFASKMHLRKKKKGQLRPFPNTASILYHDDMNHIKFRSYFFT